MREQTNERLACNAQLKQQIVVQRMDVQHLKRDVKDKLQLRAQLLLKQRKIDDIAMRTSRNNSRSSFIRKPFACIQRFDRRCYTRR